MDRDGESCEVWEGWEREYREGRASKYIECSESEESEPGVNDTSLYIPKYLFILGRALS